MLQRINDKYVRGSVLSNFPKPVKVKMVKVRAVNR